MRGTRGVLKRTASAVHLCALLGFGGGVVGCGSESSALREWKPEDHQPPPAVADETRAAPPPQGATPITDEARVARAVYGLRCAGCHGVDGRGRGPEAPPGAPIPDFTDAAFQAKEPDSAFVTAILEGRGMMPAFGDQLSEREVALLLGLVRSFAPAGATPAPGAATAGTDSPAPAQPAGNAPATP